MYFDGAVSLCFRSAIGIRAPFKTPSSGPQAADFLSTARVLIGALSTDPPCSTFRTLTTHWNPSRMLIHTAGPPAHVSLAAHGTQQHVGATPFCRGIDVRARRRHWDKSWLGPSIARC